VSTVGVVKPRGLSRIPKSTPYADEQRGCNNRLRPGGRPRHSVGSLTRILQQPRIPNGLGVPGDHLTLEIDTEALDHGAVGGEERSPIDRLTDSLASRRLQPVGATLGWAKQLVMFSQGANPSLSSAACSERVPFVPARRR
jgi:hypothetical protein